MHSDKSVQRSLSHESSPPVLIAMTIAEFCLRYCLSRSTFYREIHAGRLHPKKRGRTTVIHIEESERWYRGLPDLEVVSMDSTILEDGGVCA